MSHTNSASPLLEAPNPLLNSFAYLPTAIIGKLTRTNKIAPLFVEPHAEDEEIAYVVELACGHVLCKKNGDKQSGARSSLSSSKSLLANLSIFEATRCPMCEQKPLADKNIGSEHNSALQIAKKHVGTDTKQGLWGRLWGLEIRQSTSDERSREECEKEKLLEPPVDERLDGSFGETLVEACRWAKKALTVKSGSGLGVGVGW